MKNEFDFGEFRGVIRFNESGWVDDNEKLEYFKWVISQLSEKGEKYFFLCDNHSSN